MVFGNLIRKMDFTGQWQVRCPKCGQTKRSGEAGMIRVASKRSIGKRVLGFCKRCGGFKWLVVEPIPEPLIPPGKNPHRKRKPA